MSSNSLGEKVLDRGKGFDGQIRVVFYEPYPMGLGGNFITQKLLLERIDFKKFYPIVLAPSEGAALDHFRKMGVECLVVPPPVSLNRYGGKVLKERLLVRLKSAFDLVSYNIKLSRYLRQHSIALVYTNGVRAQLSIGLGARLANVPNLLYVKGELNNPVIDRLSLVLASKILFFCPQNRDDKYPYLIKWFAAKISILRIGLDQAFVRLVKKRSAVGLKKALKFDKMYFNTVVVAQLYRPKGQHLAIQALSKIVKEFPNVRLYLLGDHVIDEYIPYKLELDMLIKEYGLQEHVHFTGWRKDSLDIVNLMDLVIHPSLAEGFGRAVLEAMALGTPVIASAVGGLREAIKDGCNGYLVEPGDVSAIAQRWRLLISDPQLRKRVGSAAEQTVFSNYLIDDKAADMFRIWAEMAKKYE